MHLKNHVIYLYSLCRGSTGDREAIEVFGLLSEGLAKKMPVPNSKSAILAMGIAAFFILMLVLWALYSHFYGKNTDLDSDRSRTLGIEESRLKKNLSEPVSIEDSSTMDDNGIIEGSSEKTIVPDTSGELSNSPSEIIQKNEKNAGMKETGGNKSQAEKKNSSGISPLFEEAEPTETDFNDPAWVATHSGGLPAAPEQKEWMQKHRPTPKITIPNELGLKRINKEREKNGLAPLSMGEAVKQAQERALEREKGMTENEEIQ